jgi:hypothetical protein
METARGQLQQAIFLEGILNKRIERLMRKTTKKVGTEPASTDTGTISEKEAAA